MKRTTKDFKEILKEKNPNIELLGKYINSYTKTLFRCKVDGYEWETRPNTVLQGSGCPKCARKGLTMTHSDFVERMKPISPNIEIVGNYVNTYTSIECRCKIDGYTWKARPYNLLRGFGCAKCSNNAFKPYEEFVEQLHEINPNVEVIGEYKNSSTKIKCKCKIDGHEWEVIPFNLLKGYQCPKCSLKLRRKPHGEFIKELEEINPNIEVLDNYINAHTKLRCRCKKDGYEWLVRPNSLLSGSGCPKCAGNSKKKGK